MKKRFGTAVILAGGNSRRMGYDKQYLKIDGHYLILSLIEQMSPYFDQIIISCNHPVHPYHLYKGVTVVKDQYIQVGPMAGIHGALQASHSEYVYVIACDTFFYSEIMCYLRQEICRKVESDGEVAPTICLLEKDTDYFEPLNAFYHIGVFEAFERALHENCFSLQKCIRAIENKHVITVAEMGKRFKDALFINFNTKEDVKRYEKHHAIGPPKRA